MRNNSKLLSAFLLSLVLALPALAQNTGASSSEPKFNVAAEEYQFQTKEPGKAGAVLHTLTAEVSNTKTGAQAAELILDSLNPKQLAQTFVVSEDPQVFNELAGRYANLKPTQNVPTFFPYGALADNNSAYGRVKGTRFGQIWTQAREWGKAQPVGQGLIARYNYFSQASGVEAVYFTFASGLNAAGWIFVKGTSVSPAHFNATIGTVSNLIFGQLQRVAFSIIPNRFSYATDWTTDRIRKLLGRDMSHPSSLTERLVGNFATQAMINTLSVLLRAADPNSPFFKISNLESVVFSSSVSMSTSHYSQLVYERLDQLRDEKGSDLKLTDLFLTRVNMVLSTMSTFWAPTRELQEFNHRAWLVQGASIGIWYLIHKNIDRIVEFAENSPYVKAYDLGENALGRGIKATLKAPGHAYNALSKDDSCLSLFGPRL